MNAAPSSLASPIGVDKVARITLTEADRIGIEPAPRTVVVIDDNDGSLIGGAAQRWPRAELRLYCDSIRDEVAARRAARRAQISVKVMDDLERAAARTQLCLLRLPKSLDALELIAGAVARHGDPGVTMIAGGRTRHMTKSMNEVLARHFAIVRGSLGLGKSRALVATGARRRPSHQPKVGAVGDGLVAVAYGGVFAGAKIDAGTRLLLDQAEQFPSAKAAIDLGCGTGLLAVALARANPVGKITAVDSSISATRSAEATAAANGLAERIVVLRTDGLTGVADASADLIVCNPPFHDGTAKDSSAALAMIRDAARVLRPGGELWLVFNSHLPYRTALRSQIGQTDLITQDRNYTVTRSLRRP